MSSSTRQHRFDPSRPDFSPYGLTCVEWTPTPMLRPDQHNEIEINLLRSGSVTYLHGGAKTELRPGCLAVFWASVPHQIVSYTASEPYFVATIPFANVLQFRLPEAFVQRLLSGEMLQAADPSMAGEDFAQCARWLADLERPTSSRSSLVLLEMEARLCRFAHESPVAGQRYVARPSRSKATPGTPARTRSHGLNKVELMACIIAQRYREPLSVEKIGQMVGLHPNYAMGLFKKTFGTTLIDHITGHRIAHAKRLLVTSDAKILDIALDSGFNSVSRFNAAFRTAEGCTPREFRTAHGRT